MRRCKQPDTCAPASWNEGAEKSVDLKLQIILDVSFKWKCNVFLLSRRCQNPQCLLHNRLNVPYCRPGRKNKKKNLCHYRELKIHCQSHLARLNGECELERYWARAIIYYFEVKNIPHHLDSWAKRNQLDVTCFIISLFNAQHVSDVNTSILRSLRLICWVISWVVLLWFDVY